MRINRGYISKKRIYVIIPVIAICLLVPLLMSGCYGKAYSRDEEKTIVASGKKIMEGYLETLGSGYKLEEIKASDYLDRDTHRFTLDGFACGEYGNGGDIYDFAVDTDTGKIYSSERNDDFYAVLGRKILTKYGVSFSDYECAGRFTIKHPSERVPDQEGFYSYLIPVDDYNRLDALADKFLSDEEYTLDVNVLYSGAAVAEDAIDLEKADIKGDSKIKIVLTDGSNVHPGERYPGRDDVIALISVDMTKDYVKYRTFDIWTIRGPLQFYYAEHSLLTERSEDGEVTVRTFDLDPAKDVQFVFDGDIMNYYPYSKDETEKYKDWKWSAYEPALNPDIFGFLVIKDLSGNDGHEIYCVRNVYNGWDERMFIWYCDKYAASSGMNRPFVLNYPEEFVFGNEAVRLLEEQEKEKEEK